MTQLFLVNEPVLNQLILQGQTHSFAAGPFQSLPIEQGVDVYMYVRFNNGYTSESIVAQNMVGWKIMEDKVRHKQWHNNHSWFDVLTNKISIDRSSVGNALYLIINLQQSKNQVQSVDGKNYVDIEMLMRPQQNQIDQSVSQQNQFLTIQNQQQNQSANQQFINYQQENNNQPSSNDRNRNTQGNNAYQNQNNTTPVQNNYHQQNQSPNSQRNYNHPDQYTNNHNSAIMIAKQQHQISNELNLNNQSHGMRHNNSNNSMTGLNLEIQRNHGQNSYQTNFDHTNDRNQGQDQNQNNLNDQTTQNNRTNYIGHNQNNVGNQQFYGNNTIINNGMQNQTQNNDTNQNNQSYSNH